MTFGITKASMWIMLAFYIFMIYIFLIFFTDWNKESPTLCAGLMFVLVKYFVGVVITNALYFSLFNFYSIKYLLKNLKL